MQRIGRVARLRPEMAEEYRRLHREVWPEVLAALRRAGIRNYTIFQHADLLFSTMEYVGQDYAADRARLLAEEAMQRWNALTGPCIEPAPASGGVAWAALEELFHLE